MGYKAAVQVLKQAEELKAKVSKKCDWLNNNEAWTDQQKLQNLYHQVLVLDLEYALDKKVEQDLWTIGFRNHISSLQEAARNKKNPFRSDSQVLLTWALESASGFFITLFEELCNTFDIDVPFRRRGNIYGQTTQNFESVNLPQASSCLYICQYCLVHLGDIARYRNQRKQAESFYKQAIMVSPTSGHPYNQLALLEASQGNKLSTVFYYIRSIALKNPFPASATNLSSTLSSAINKESISEKIPTKMTVNEFVQLFLCTHGYFHMTIELPLAESAVKSLNSIMTALVATQGFTSEMLIKITIINLFALKHVQVDKNQVLSDSKTKVKELVLELIAGSLCAFLVPIHTLKVDETLLDYYALPAVKIMLYFIQNEPDVLKDKVFADRLLIWPSLVKLVNNSQKYLKGINFNKYNKYPLNEDRGLQGFQPLSRNFEDFNFTEELDDPRIEKLLRIKRITDISLWLTEVDVNGTKLIVKTENNGEINLEPLCVQPDPTNELLEKMKSFSIETTVGALTKTIERKAGILKPQGSLEKSREERETLSSASVNENVVDLAAGSTKVDLVKIKRGKQNVALQSIFKKMEESNKQVKFIDDEPDKEKFDPIAMPHRQKSTPQQLQQQHPNTQPFNMSLRTQSFNQNHPAFPLPPPPSQPDYLLSLRGQAEKAANYHFSKTDSLQSNNFMPAYQNSQAKSVGAGLNTKSNTYQSNVPQTSFVSSGFQGLQYPSNSFNAWKREEVAPPPPPVVGHSWWHNAGQSAQQQNPGYRQPSNYPPQNVPPPLYSNNLMPPPPPPMMQSSKNQGGGGDIFNVPWSNYGGGYLGEAGIMGGLDSAKQNMSIRQAMLKEATLPHQHIGQSDGSMSRFPNQSQDNHFMQNAAHAPGYSLFNASSWTPNLAGQLISNKQSENNTALMSQQSLFSENNAPKSLAQLLEHQQNQLNKDLH